MAENNFKIKDGFYRITEKQKPDLKKFFIEQMKENPRTSKGNLSKAGINTKTIIVDGPNGQYEAFFKGDGKRWKFNQQSVQKKSADNRALNIKNNRPTLEVFEEAGRLWDELVGKKGKFTMGDRTFNSKKEYQEFEAKRHDTITKNKEKLNRIGGKTHGHAVPPKHQYAVETYMQSFPEDASPNYSSQDKVPKDFKKRLTKADIPTTKTEVAKRHVGTSDRITNPIPDSIKEKLLKYFKINGNGSNGTNGHLKVNGGGTAAMAATNNPMNFVQKGTNLAQLGMRNLSLLNMISEGLTKKKFTSHVGDTVKRGADNLRMTIVNPKQRAKDIKEQQDKLNTNKDFLKIARKNIKRTKNNMHISTL